jgi:hypothetical protein
LKFDIKQIVGSINVNQFAPKTKLVATANEEFYKYIEHKQQEPQFAQSFEWKLMSFKRPTAINLCSPRCLTNMRYSGLFDMHIWILGFRARVSKDKNAL